MILTGRYGKVSYDPIPASPAVPVEVISINGFTLSMKTDYEDVTCFNATNKAKVPGIPDLSGNLTGFWNSAELTLIHAARATTPGYLELMPNRNEPTFLWGGPGYMDVDLNATLQAPKLSGTWTAGGDWIIP